MNEDIRTKLNRAVEACMAEGKVSDDTVAEAVSALCDSGDFDQVNRCLVRIANIPFPMMELQMAVLKAAKGHADKIPSFRPAVGVIIRRMGWMGVEASTLLEPN